MKFAQVDGVRLGYERTGSGQAVVLAGGTGMPPVAWQLCALVDELVASGFEVVTFAARGVSPSDAPPSPYSIPEMANDLAGLLDHLGLSGCHIVYSLGGFVTEVLARTRPELVRAAVLLASAGPVTATLRAALETEAALISELGYLPDTFARFETLHTFLAPSVLRDDDAEVDKWWQLFGAKDGIWASPEGACGQSVAAQLWTCDTERLAQLGDIAQPVLVVAFEHDPFFPPRAGREAARLLQQSSFVEIAGAAHGGLMTDPHTCAQVLLPFLASV